MTILPCCPDAPAPHPLRRHLDPCVLTRLFPELSPAHITPDRGRRLPAQADDCGRRQLQRSISPVVLRTKPQPEDRLPLAAPKGVRPIAYATGHSIDGDRMVMTTPLWFADRDGARVGSLCRFCLMRPAHPDGVCRRLSSNAASAGDSNDDSSEDRS